MSSLISSLKQSYLGKLAKKVLKGKPRSTGFAGSSAYWEKRYAKNSNSGAGSYGRLANFKAEVLNDFVSNNNIQTVIEYGVGDGNQLSLAKYPYYVGFDVSKTAIELCRSRFKDDHTKEFYLTDNKEHLNDKAQLTLSLDVLYHLVEDEVFDAYMKRLFDTATAFVIIYSSNFDDHFAPHVRSRKFTDWVDQNVSEQWKLKTFIENIYPFDEANPDHTSMADFYVYSKMNPN